ncbi:S-layer homology domain-containing protein [Paenibacillus sp. strain BS8-2]
MLDAIRLMGTKTRLAAISGCALTLLLLPGCFGGDNNEGGNAPTSSTGVETSQNATQTPVVSPTADPAAAGQEVVVTDLGGHPSDEAVAEFLAMGAVQVDNGEFRPNELITRGEWFNWLIGLEYRDLSLDASAGGVFADVDDSTANAKLLNGYGALSLIEAMPDGKLHLDEPLTREQVPYTWAKFMEDDGAFRFPASLPPSVFLDVEELDEQYKKPMSLYKKEYKKTFGDTPFLRPKEPVTRAEAAEWMIYILDNKSSLKEKLNAGGSKSVTIAEGTNGESGVGGQGQGGEPTDIAGHKFESEIGTLLKSAGAVGENGFFEPDKDITRGEFIEWAYLYHGRGINPHHPEQPSFSDLSVDHVYYDVIEGLRAAGILNGFPDGTIRVDEPLTREQATRIWADYIRDWTALIENLYGYEDADKVGKLYIGSMTNYLVEGTSKLYRTVLIGDTKKLEPQKPMSRAEAAAWIVLGTEGE